VGRSHATSPRLPFEERSFLPTLSRLTRLDLGARGSRQSLLTTSIFGSAIFNCGSFQRTSVTSLTTSGTSIPNIGNHVDRHVVILDQSCSNAAITCLDVGGCIHRSEDH
jgi:hypothetical protein